MRYGLPPNVRDFLPSRFHSYLRQHYLRQAENGRRRVRPSLFDIKVSGDDYDYGGSTDDGSLPGSQPGSATGGALISAAHDLLNLHRTPRASDDSDTTLHLGGPLPLFAPGLPPPMFAPAPPPQPPPLAFLSEGAPHSARGPAPTHVGSAFMPGMPALFPGYPGFFPYVGVARSLGGSVRRIYISYERPNLDGCLNV